MSRKPLILAALALTLPLAALAQGPYKVLKTAKVGGEGGFDYIAGVQVKSRDNLPASFRCIEIKPQRYAVFVHQGHISTLHQTFYTIWNHWLPHSGFAAAEAPEFERYSEDFDPVAGTGVLEIWLPVKDRDSLP